MHSSLSNSRCPPANVGMSANARRPPNYISTLAPKQQRFLQVLQRSVRFAIGPCSLALHTSRSSCSASTCSAAPDPAGLALHAGGLHGAASPAAGSGPERRPTLTLNAAPLTAWLLVADPPQSPAGSRGSGGPATAAAAAAASAAGHAPEALSASSSMLSAFSGSADRPVTADATQHAQRSVLIAQLSSGCVAPASGAADILTAARAFGGLGNAVDVAATPSRPVTVTAGFDVGCGHVHADVAVEPAVAVADAALLPSVLSVASRVLGSVAAGGSSTSSVCTGTTTRPTVPIPPAPRASPQSAPTTQTAAQSAGATLSCRVRAVTFTAAALQPIANDVDRNVAMVAQVCTSGSADVQRTQARCTIEMPTAAAYVAPCAACSVVCEGAAPLSLRPVACAAELSGATVSMSTTAGHAQLAQHTPEANTSASDMSYPLAVAGIHGSPAPPQGSTVRVGLNVHDVKFAVGAEEIAVVQQLMHACYTAQLSELSTEGPHSACSTGTPPASQQPSMPPSLPVPTVTRASHDSSYDPQHARSMRPPAKTVVDTVIDHTSAALATLSAASCWTLECTVRAVEATLIQRHGVGCATPADAGRGGLVITPLVAVAARTQRQRRTVVVAATAAGVTAEAAAAVEVRVLNTLCQQWDVLLEEWPLTVRAGMQPARAAPALQVRLTPLELQPARSVSQMPAAASGTLQA